MNLHAWRSVMPFPAEKKGDAKKGDADQLARSARVPLISAKGASLADPLGLFKSSLEGNTRRAIDFHEDDRIDEKAFQALIRAAVALNTSGYRSPGPLSEETKERLI